MSLDNGGSRRGRWRDAKEACRCCPTYTPASEALADGANPAILCDLRRRSSDTIHAEEIDRRLQGLSLTLGCSLLMLRLFSQAADVKNRKVCGLVYVLIDPDMTIPAELTQSIYGAINLETAWIFILTHFQSSPSLAQGSANQVSY